MEEATSKAAALRRQIATAEEELKSLRVQLDKIESNQQAEGRKHVKVAETARWPLSPAQYHRYGRQMVVPSIGITGPSLPNVLRAHLISVGQLRIRSASVLIIGAGGLGCPAAAYVAAAGVKRLGLVDGDTVEVSNLHRQILHNTGTVGEWKVDSAIEYLKKLNPDVQYDAYKEQLTPHNALDIVARYDIVLDCTDNPKSRYLTSDACVLHCKPLVSASALKTDGQIVVLNYPPRPPGGHGGGPCYRCVFPKPPPPDQVANCGEDGIIGPVVGTMGVLQALEAIKLIVAGISIEHTTHSEFANCPAPSPSLLIFSSYSPNQFRTVRLRSRRPDCFACSAKAGLTKESMQSGSLDYVAFCGTKSPTRLLKEGERVTAMEYDRLKSSSGEEHVLVDVREKVHFDICNIKGSVNIPFSQISTGALLDQSWLPEKLPDDAPIHVICRLGNDSQIAARRMQASPLGADGKRYIGDIEGGLKAWREQVDPSWPDY